MNKIKFSFGYENAVDYVLNKMDGETRKRFEEELKFNKELQEFVRDAEAKKDLLLSYDNFKPSDEFYQITLAKIKNLSKTETPVKPGRIFLLDISNVLYTKLERQILSELYFLAISDPKYSLSGEDVRVIPLSKNVHYAKTYDIILTEKMVSFKKFGVIAHMHLVTNILTKRLKYYVGDMNNQNFKAIKQADLHDYSLVDGKKILSGKDFANMNKEIEFWRDSAEVWYDFVSRLLMGFRYEIIDKYI